jgi:hypothetical protein
VPSVANVATLGIRDGGSVSFCIFWLWVAYLVWGANPLGAKFPPSSAPELLNGRLRVRI